jgi:hypothetical protein
MKNYTKKDIERLELSNDELKMFDLEISRHHVREVEYICNSDEPWHNSLSTYMWKNDKRRNIIALSPNYPWIAFDVTDSVAYVSKKSYDQRLEHIDIVNEYTKLTEDELIMFNDDIIAHQNGWMDRKILNLTGCGDDDDDDDDYINDNGETFDLEDEFQWFSNNVEYVWNFQHDIYGKITEESSEDYFLVKPISKVYYKKRQLQY